MHNFDYKFHFDDSKNYLNDFKKKIGKIVHHLDFPVGSLSSFPLWKLAQTASKKVKVVLSGEGADEMFMGYPEFLTRRYDYFIKSPYRLLDSLYGLNPSLKR